MWRKWRLTIAGMVEEPVAGTKISGINFMPRVPATDVDEVRLALVSG